MIVFAKDLADVELYLPKAITAMKEELKNAGIGVVIDDKLNFKSQHFCIKMSNSSMTP